MGGEEDDDEDNCWAPPREGECVALQCHQEPLACRYGICIYGKRRDNTVASEANRQTQQTDKTEPAVPGYHPLCSLLQQVPIVPGHGAERAVREASLL